VQRALQLVSMLGTAAGLEGFQRRLDSGVGHACG
jgi:hypothetical protein